MEFRKRLPHCENLTSAEAKFVRKLVKAEYTSDVESLARSAVDTLSVEGLRAVLRQPGMGRDTAKSIFTQTMIEKGKLDHIDQVFDDISVLSYSDKRGILKVALGYADSGFVSRLLKIAGEGSLGENAMRDALMYYTKMRQDNLCLMIREYGIDVHFATGELMKYALLRNYANVVDALLEKGFDSVFYNVQTEAFLNENTATYEAWTLFREKIKCEVTAPAAEVTDDYHRPTDDSLTITHALPDGGRLTTVFNFALHQQTVIAQLPGHAAVPAVVPFSQIENREGLRAAAAAFVRLGGRAELASSLTDGATWIAAAPGKKIIQK